MSRFAEIFADRPVLADGAMGTLLNARGVFTNRSYDELNLSDPNLILGIHEEYLQAGAEILETNTFGANRFRLTRHGLGAKVEEINAARPGWLVRWDHWACDWSRWARPVWMKRARLSRSRLASSRKAASTC
jgi:hypothetical protein